jgi:hypothetical protein
MGEWEKFGISAATFVGIAVLWCVFIYAYVKCVDRQAAGDPKRREKLPEAGVSTGYGTSR